MYGCFWTFLNRFIYISEVFYDRYRYRLTWERITKDKYKQQQHCTAALRSAPRSESLVSLSLHSLFPSTYISSFSSSTTVQGRIPQQVYHLATEVKKQGSHHPRLSKTHYQQGKTSKSSSNTEVQDPPSTGGYCWHNPNGQRLRLRETAGIEVIQALVIQWNSVRASYSCPAGWYW